MRPVRVDGALYTVGPLHCPRCGRVEGKTSVYGILHYVCSGTACHRPLTAVRLPPGTRGVEIVELYGADVARALHRVHRFTDDGCSEDALREWPLPIPTEYPTYLIRMRVERIQKGADIEPPVGWRQARRMIGTLLGWHEK